MKSESRMPFLMAWAAMAASCYLPAEDCDFSHCPRSSYEIAAESVTDAPPWYTPIDTVDSGQLSVHVRWKSSALPKRAAAAAASTDCVGCEDILEGSSLTFDQPILAGADTVPAFTNLLAEAVLPKVGTGGGSSLTFHEGVRFRKGENNIAFVAEFREGSKRIGSLSLTRTLQVGEISSW